MAYHVQGRYSEARYTGLPCKPAGQAQGGAQDVEPVWRQITTFDVLKISSVGIYPIHKKISRLPFLML